MAGPVLFDTDVLVDVARGVPTALDVVEAASDEHILTISTITQLELIAGCRNKAELREADRFVQRFAILPPGDAACEEAVKLLRRFRLSHGLQITDALIAATALTDELPLVSKNQRDFRFIPALRLLPYPPRFS
ncbi:MAG TPA: type II toxin-antitoxin system VapC family toxin [Longimicrobium sp.]